jgi:DNA uptake protein ComE-like DNA-binding protein
MIKKFLQEYASFTRMERAGFTALAIAIMVLFTVWQAIPYLYPTAPATTVEEKKLALAWEQFRQEHLLQEENAGESYASNAGNIPVQLTTFDPNTLDSTGFLRLGLPPRVVKGLLNWRRHGKKFYKKEDLKPLYGLTEADYNRLAPYISISITNPYSGSTFANSYTKLPPLPATLDLNTTDSATIVRLNGIGPTLAHKILERRAALGGYLKHEQLLEVYKFNDSTFTMLRQKLVIRPEAIKKIGINTATTEQLQAHPYIGEKMAKNILMLRNGLKRFEQIQQLRQVPLMNEENYRKIAPYLIVD